VYCSTWKGKGGILWIVYVQVILTMGIKMIEIGRRDFNGRAQLNMDLFEGNRGFIGVNLAALADLYGE